MMLMTRNRPQITLTLGLFALTCAVHAVAADESSIHNFGAPAVVDANERQITLTPETRWVNVTNGETVKFVVGAKEFAWHFSTELNGAQFDFADIAPSDAHIQNVRVYVSPRPGDVG